MSFNASGQSSKSSSQQTSQTYYDPTQKALANNNYTNLAAAVNDPNSPLSYKAYSGPSLNYGNPTALTNLTNYSAPTVSADQINGMTSSFLNPFTTNVVDQTNAALARQNAIDNNNAASQATQAGAFGGSRSAVLQNLNTDSYQRNLGLTDANLFNMGFQGAQNAALTTAQGNQQADLAGANTRLQALGLNAQQAEQIFGANWQQYLNSQQDPQGLQALVNQALSLTPQGALSTAQGTSTGKGSGFGLGFSAPGQK